MKLSFFSSIAIKQAETLSFETAHQKFLAHSETICGGDCCKPIPLKSAVRRSNNNRHPWACMNQECNIENEPATGILVSKDTVLLLIDIPEFVHEVASL